MMGAAAPTKAAGEPTLIPDPDNDPAVQRARETWQTLVAHETAANERLRRLSDVLDPYAAASQPVTPDDRLDAIEHFAGTRVEAARAAKAALQAERAWQQAREAARDKVRAACHERKQTLVQTLATLLERAAAVNRELSEVEDRERTLTGDWFRTGLAWPELCAATPTQGSRLADWERAATEAKLLTGTPI